MQKLSTTIYETYPIGFTPRGKVCVIDVIKVWCRTNRPFSLWGSLITDHPEILTDCENYPFRQGEALPVGGGKGWKQVLDLIPYYRLK